MTGFFEAVADMFKPVRLKVLVADDSALQLSVVKKMLLDLGHVALVAENPEQVVPLALDERPDVIMLDMNMGRLSGIGVMELLQMDARLAAIPVVICTFEQIGTTKSAAKRMGAAAYLEKPLRAEALKAVLAPIEQAKKSRRS